MDIMLDPSREREISKGKGKRQRQTERKGKRQTKMGVILTETTDGCELRGWGFVWHYPTREKAEQDRGKAWQQHMANIAAFQWVANALLSFR